MDDRTMTPALRNTSTGATARVRDSNPHLTPEPGSWEAFRGVGDPDQRYSLWRLCPCIDCDGTGKVQIRARVTYATGTMPARCPDCRGEGRTRELVATCGTPEAVGVALVTLGREGEWADCPLGCLDSMGEKGQRWIVKPWTPSPREVSAAAKLLRAQRNG